MFKLVSWPHYDIIRFEESYDLRVLKTKETVLNNQIDAFDAPLLEVGNIILGLTASLICAAELRLMLLYS
jgi:hypothetical protein